MKKKILCIFILSMLTCSNFSSFFISVQAASNGIITVSSDLTILVNGNKVNFTDAQPFIDSAGRTQVPIRFIAEEFGYEVEWKKPSNINGIPHGGVTIRGDDIPVLLDGKTVYRTLFLGIGSNVINIADFESSGGSGYTKNGYVQMDTEAMIKNGRTYIPLRYVAVLLGFTVEYNNISSGNSNLTGEEAIELVKQEINKGEVISKEYISLLKLKFSFADRGNYYIVNATATAYADGTIKYLVYKSDKSLKYLGQASDWSDTEYDF